MSPRLSIVTLALVLAAATAACNDLPGRPGAASAVPRSGAEPDFDGLYAENCAACHGTRGVGGAAIALADPVYLAFADDDVLRAAIAKGVPGTPMPAFAQTAGGMLTEQQIAALVKGIRQWPRPGALGGARPPPYAAGVPGDPARGAGVYRIFCSACHGPDGNGGEKAGSIVDPSFLALVSDQGLRTIVIVGRPELGAPDWRNNVPGRSMTDQEVADVVVWLETHRAHVPGQPYPAGGAAAGKGGQR